MTGRKWSIILWIVLATIDQMFRFMERNMGLHVESEIRSKLMCDKNRFLAHFITECFEHKGPICYENDSLREEKNNFDNFIYGTFVKCVKYFDDICVPLIGINIFLFFLLMKRKFFCWNQFCSEIKSSEVQLWTFDCERSNFEKFIFVFRYFHPRR